MDNQGKCLLHMEGVVKDFGGLKAINDVSLQIDEREIRGLIGPNASGKTTLTNLITGIYKVTAGSIYFSGKRIDGLQPDVVASIGIMRTFQIPRVFRDMTVLENMMVPALSQGQSMMEAKARAEELLEFALLTRLKDEPAKSLSGGQNMLLQIVRGLMNKNLRLYIMDEPFSGVHQSIKGIIINAIRMMNRENGVTFLIISHEMTTISSLCDQISVLHKGEVISQGTMEEVANDPLVIDAYLGG
ncbi:MAG: ABC transporter ATP-binding protein [Desulfobacteraceae bacterium]|nr:ABC transporter ATP-binding protein [Desulfobacteraceae bacterium]